MTTATWDLKSGTHQFGHRTNSLAFSKYDCHTCAALKKTCDRRRPCCGTCKLSERQCGGFALDLVWKHPPSRGTETPRRPDVRGREKKDEQPVVQHDFKFVRGRPAKKRRKPLNARDAEVRMSKFRLEGQEKQQTSPSTDLKQPKPSEALTPLASYRNESQKWTEWLSNWLADGSPTAPSPWSFDSPKDLVPPETIQIPEPADSSSHMYSPSEQTSDPHLVSYNARGANQSPKEGPIRSESESTSLLEDSETWDGIVEDEASADLWFPSTIKFQSLAQKYSSMFDMFNQEFCVIPLSTDCRHNPFRARTDYAESFPFLFHAVMAITAHHLSRKNNCAILGRESLHHWSTAVQSFSTSLPRAGFLPLLDTILILINFESTQSLYGSLDMHLGGAKTLIEQSGALQRFHKSSRLRAQLAMLIWWDATSSFIARRKTRFANNYINLLSVYDDDADGWSFVALNGCPTSFVVAMGRLSELAEAQAQGDAVAERVDEVLHEVKNYSLSEMEDVECEDEDAQDPDKKQNRSHCVEAWRYAILLYARRVFTAWQDLQGLRKIKHHARVILDSARCIPPSEPFQKQLLLPVFLAGAEVGDEFSRAFVRQYCQHWRTTSNFDQFSGAEALVETIWSDWSPWNRDTYWWGVKVGRAEDEAGDHLPKQLLLG